MEIKSFMSVISLNVNISVSINVNVLNSPTKKYSDQIDKGIKPNIFLKRRFT